MDLNCLNNIITNDLIVNFDLTENKSWNLNTGLTITSLNKYPSAISDNLTLNDWGLTNFDVGKTTKMWTGITLTPNDTYFKLDPVSENIVYNPTQYEYSGVTILNDYSSYSITGVSDNQIGNYFELSGGYLQNYFKLENYNYELLPPRYNEGITIETLIYLYPESNGIFYLMGARAEDKYNPYFSGETTIKGTVNDVKDIEGVVTSLNNHLDAIEETKVSKNSFKDFKDREKIVNKQTSSEKNTNSNIIAFEITNDKKLAYKYLDANNIVIKNESEFSISPQTGWTTISITYEPDEIIDDIDLLSCYKRRNGKLIFYVNGRSLWTVNDFPEFFFKAFQNDKEKQIGLPYNISWGGGSFGLKNSWHYDKQTYVLYTGESSTYINNNFIFETDPLPSECDVLSPETPISGFTLSADSTTFIKQDKCDPSINYPVTVMKITSSSGSSLLSGITLNKYFLKFDNPITVLSNREYDISLSLYNDNFFNSVDENGNGITNKISLLMYGDVDVNVINDIEYKYPLSTSDISRLPNAKTNILFENEYEYVKNGIMYYGPTGEPVFDLESYYNYLGISKIDIDDTVINNVVTGNDIWLNLNSKFEIKENTGKQQIHVGLLIETTGTLNYGNSLYVKDFVYTGRDVLNKDPNKQNLLIEQNFNSSINCKIQKLRLYNKPLKSNEILHNSYMEMKKNQYLNLKVSKGGRIIYR